jgi:hypothetical protein
MFRVLQMSSVITSEWFAILGTIGEQAHVVLAIFVCGYFLLIAMTAIVAAFHREADFLGWRIQRRRRQGDTRNFVYTYTRPGRDQVPWRGQTAAMAAWQPKRR